ncbi:MAG TPA: HlyD family secretion protein [Parafilimonas sp.]|jgi:membrane fusion protein (multidrug efflux system)|nr:HlyD family secretion protein [Parafilimonas sp.]
MAKENQEQKTDIENNQPKKKKSPLRFIIIGIIVIAGLIYGWTKISYAITHETTDDAQIETQISPVLPRVGGYVKYIAVKDYDSVKSGQLLVQLDDAELQAQLLQMQADYEASKADITNAQAALKNAQISLGSNRGDIQLSSIKVQQAKDDYQRNQNLFNDQAITKKQLDDSRYNLEQATQQASNNQSELSTAQSRIAVLRAALTKAQAALGIKEAAIKQQQLKISYTQIFAPQSGKLGKLNITTGQYVQPGAPLFSIVNDTTYWVIANFKETQIRKFHQGMPVAISLDAYPDSTLNGTVGSLSEATGARFSILPPDNSSGNFIKVTQRVPVKIDITNIPRYRNILRAGLSAYVSIPTK